MTEIKKAYIHGRQCRMNEMEGWTGGRKNGRAGGRMTGGRMDGRMDRKAWLNSQDGNLDFLHIRWRSFGSSEESGQTRE